MLIGQFWGTSAAEGIPAPFCRCPGCEEARKNGGKSLRTRSCFRLSDKIMLDLGADAVTQSAKFGDLADVEHILITHTHEDHLNPHMFMELVWGRAYTPKKPTHFYLTEDAFKMVEHWRKTPWIVKGILPKLEKEGLVVFHKLSFGERIEIDGCGITPLEGNHKGNVGENSALYLIDLPDGRKLFYGLDSGPYLPQTLEALKAHQIDLFISECSLGLSDAKNPGHLSFPEVETLLKQLADQGTLTAKSHVWISHISHRTSHPEMVAAAEKLSFPFPVEIAWDGLKIL